MGYTDQEKYAMIGIKELQRAQKPATPEAIRHAGRWATLDKDERTLAVMLDRLVGIHLVERAGDCLTLTPKGAALAKQFDAEGFGKWMVTCERSSAYRKFCLKVYGVGRCQFNMMTQEQLGKLTGILRLDENDAVLELGCGIGTITEHIADLTGARIVGVDFSADAIQAARDRNLGKRRNLSFEVMDMDDLHLPTGGFDAVIIIDAVYFVQDLCSVVAAAKGCLRDRGRMAILYTTHVSPEEPRQNLAPENTPLAKALQSCELAFQTWDYTEDEKGVWERHLQAAEELKTEFDAEGNLWICEGRVTEAQWALEYCRTGRSGRYLYFVAR